MRLHLARLLLAAVLVALPAAATVVIAQTMEELARSSPLVARARVHQVQSSWNDKHTTIETWAEVELVDVLKGTAPVGTTLLIRNPGGVVGDIGAYAAGAPQFATGEDTLLFLEPARDDSNIWLVSALAAGKVTFAKTSLGDIRAKRDLRGITFYQRPNAGKLHELSKPEDLGTPEEFLARIRAAVAKAAHR